MLSYELCKEILNQNGKTYTDNQIKAIRSFLYQLAEIEYLNFKTTDNAEKRDFIHTGLNR